MKLLDRVKLARAALSGRLKARYGPEDMRFLHGTARGHVEDFDVSTAYESSAIAFACIDRIAKDAAGVPLVYLRDPEDYENQVQDGDPVRRVFTYPAPGFTTRRLISWTVMLRQLRGEAFWVIDGGRSGPQRIVPWFDPLGWRERVSAEEGLFAWEYQRGNVQFIRPAGEVFWVGQDNPENPYRGISPLKAASGAVGIDVMGDSLTQDIISRGGERGLVLSTDVWLQDDQYEQLRARIAARRRGGGMASDDFVIDSGLKLENPDFTSEDLDILSRQNAAKDKICHVYGMAPVLIGDDDAAQFKSAPEAIKLYWQQTLVPLLRSFEDAWDRYFVGELGLQTYVRFDLSRVAALQEDEAQRASTASIYSSMGIPLVAINDKLGLGFDDEDLLIADIVAQQRPQDEEGQPQAERSMVKGLTNEIIRKRALDPRFKVQRERMIGRIERSTWNALDRVIGKAQAEVIDDLKAAVDEYGMTPRAALEVTANLRNRQAELGNSIVRAVEPGSMEAAQVGAASIRELVDGKFMAWHDRQKEISFRPQVGEIMRSRSRYLRSNVAGDWTEIVSDLVTELVRQAGDEGTALGKVVSNIRAGWQSISRSRAATIARTEVGTMYNAARYEEMDATGFKKHEWFTALDEMTRDGENSEFDHASADGEVVRVGDRFSTKLTYPQESGGDPGNVINCRCSTIPVVED